MNWPSQKKNVSKKRRQEIMHITNNRHLNNSHQSIQPYPAHSYSHVLAQSNSPGHPTSVTSVNSPPGYTNPVPTSITFQIHPISAFEKSSISNAVISVLKIQSKTMRFRAPFSGSELSSCCKRPPSIQNGLCYFTLVLPIYLNGLCMFKYSVYHYSHRYHSQTNRQQRQQMITRLCQQQFSRKKNPENQQRKIYQSSLVKTGSSSSHP